MTGRSGGKTQKTTWTPEGCRPVAGEEQDAFEDPFWHKGHAGGICNKTMLAAGAVTSAASTSTMWGNDNPEAALAGGSAPW